MVTSVAKIFFSDLQKDDFCFQNVGLSPAADAAVEELHNQKKKLGKFWVFYFFFFLGFYVVLVSTNIKCF